MALWSSGLYYVIAPEEIGRRSCFLTFNAVLEQKQIAFHQLVCFKTLHPDFCCSERFHYFHARLPFEMPPSLVCTLRVTLLVLSQVTASFSPAIGSLQLFPQLSFWLNFYILCLLWQFFFSPACTSPPAPCMANGVKKKSLILTICCPHRCSITVIGQHVKVLHQQNTREGIQLYISMMSSALPHFWRIHSCGSKLIQIISV